MEFLNYMGEFGSYVLPRGWFTTDKTDPQFEGVRKNIAVLQNMIPNCWSQEKEILEMKITDLELMAARYDDVCLKNVREPIYYSCRVLRHEFFRAMEDTQQFFHGSIIMKNAHEKSN